jgi:hypothetical protein
MLTAFWLFGTEVTQNGQKFIWILGTLSPKLLLMVAFIWS